MCDLVECIDTEDSDEMDLTYASDAELDEDNDMMVTLGHLQGNWDKYEKEYQESLEGQHNKEELSFKEKVAEGRQIFDTKAAYKLLCKELLSIMQSVQMRIEMFHCCV